LEKSTTFAAYASHGVVPILPEACITPDTLGVTSGQQFLSSAQQGVDDSGLRKISTTAFEWYQGHGAMSQIAVFAKLLS
jgi:hypothetical protein